MVKDRCPDAVRCADGFHVVAWATGALDEVRRQAWNDARKLARDEPKRLVGRPSADAPPRPGHQRARTLKGARYALWKNPEDLTVRQGEMLSWIAKTDPRLHRAYLLKEGLRHVFAVKGQAGKDALDRWLRMGPPLPDPGVRRPAATHRQAHGVDPRRDRGPMPRFAGVNATLRRGPLLREGSPSAGQVETKRHEPPWRCSSVQVSPVARWIWPQPPPLATSSSTEALCSSCRSFGWAGAFIAGSCPLVVALS